MQIFIIGAGKSATHIIDYLSAVSGQLGIKVKVADTNASNLELRCAGKLCEQILLTTGTIDELAEHIQSAFIVVSMLPPALHVSVAKICLESKSHLITPSYTSDDMQLLNQKAKAANLIFLNEMGLDPGIDHMCCLKIIDEYQSKGAKIHSLKSHCGALISAKSDTNLWHYKISWNPRNVVLAGAGNDYIKYRANGEDVLLKYEELFAHTMKIKVGEDSFESYPNRDSLKYEKLYHIDGIETLYRGTLRIPAYCKAWNKLVNFGATSTQSPFPKIERSDVEIDEEVLAMFEELGVFELYQNKGNACDVLQQAIESKWKMLNHDIDRVVMIHEIEIEENGVRKQIQSSMILDGDDQLHTALSKTVGLPIAFAAELIIQNEIADRGVLMPLSAELYNPILNKLEAFGVRFKEVIIEQ